MDSSNRTDRILIVALAPYFLEKGNVWFEEHLKELLEARKTQQFFQDNALILRQHQGFALTELLRKLDELGYEKVFSVREPGEFAKKGGIVEVFPINAPHAFRIEFAGNTIENIQALDVAVEDEARSKEILKKRLKSQKLFSDLKGLKEGDYLVHLDHGVGKFEGIAKVQDAEYYVLAYAAGDKLYVPLGLERKLSRYVGFADPKISRLSSPVWIKTKRKIKEEVEKLAREILELYAKREIALRPPYHEPGDLGKHVASTFPFEETPDQLQAIEDVKKDLLSPKPMDRVVAGDVGFGKTEIALRAVVHAVENGFQAALLVPTTILALQHYERFQERLKNLPIKTALLSRLQRNERSVLEGIRNGSVDIVIGTHRLLSKDVQFKNLGLLVIDDEQRFGVKQKEKLKEFRLSLDVLSLSATPIPRTLYMALSSLKDMNVIQTPPPGRGAVNIMVAPRNKRMLKEAIAKELARKGQIYYLHNRVGTIEHAKTQLQNMQKGMRVGVAHGRMNERQLMEAMEKFKNKAYDVLLATTIIENGLDLPNVNTLIVEDAAKLGLSQAYQLRGRVGRSHAKAHAYFFHSSRLSEKAKLRLAALKEATEPGSGYRIALRDLEIRGAGNILGKEQSGSINAIGLNLYCQMLAESVEKLRNA